MLSVERKWSNYCSEICSVFEESFQANESFVQFRWLVTIWLHLKIANAKPEIEWLNWNQSDRNNFGHCSFLLSMATVAVPASVFKKQEFFVFFFNGSVFLL